MAAGPSPLIVLVAGETSGDNLGAHLIEALRARLPGARFAGIAGPRMLAAGCEPWERAENLAVMGLFEIASYFVVRRKRPELPTSRMHPWGPLTFLIMACALCILGAKDNPKGVLISFGIVAAMGLIYAVTRPKLVVPEPGATGEP